MTDPDNVSDIVFRLDMRQVWVFVIVILAVAAVIGAVVLIFKLDSKQKDEYKKKNFMLWAFVIAIIVVVLLIGFGVQACNEITS